MNRYRRLLIGISCVLLVSTLAACSVPIPGRLLLSGAPPASVSSPAAAIEADGTRHFAWGEPDPLVPNTQGIRYYRVNPDGTSHTTAWYPYPAELFNNYGSPPAA